MTASLRSKQVSLIIGITLATCFAVVVMPLSEGCSEWVLPFLNLSSPIKFLAMSVAMILSAGSERKVRWNSLSGASHRGQAVSQRLRHRWGGEVRVSGEEASGQERQNNI
jgi:hypothetical protein